MLEGPPRQFRIPCPSCHGRGYRVRQLQPLARLPLLVQKVRGELEARGLTTLARAQQCRNDLFNDRAFGALALMVLEQALYSGDRKTLRRLFPNDPAAFQEETPPWPEVALDEAEDLEHRPNPSA